MSPHYRFSEPALLTHRGKGREGKGREGKNLTIHSQLTSARPEPRRWMAADAALGGGRR